MKEKPQPGSVVAVIGDLVNSRTHERIHLHETLSASLTHIAHLGISPLKPTVGDEIQGTFPTLNEALKATFLLRTELLTEGIDIRFGIGIGEARTIDPALNIQDGSAWWHARDALNHIEELANTAGYSGVRTHIESTPPPTTECADASQATVGTTPPTTHLPTLNATLHLIDSHISTLKPAVCGTLRGLLTGESNQETANRLGISPSANSQRTAANNLRPLAATMQALGE